MYWEKKCGFMKVFVDFDMRGDFVEPV